MSVIVTPTAIKEVGDIMKQQNLNPETTCLRVGVKGGGCSGFSYLLDLTENQKETDEVWTCRAMVVDGKASEAAEDSDAENIVEVRVICDPKALYLNGTTVDFRDELMGRGFVFNNPNANATCGCGSSFSA